MHILPTKIYVMNEVSCDSTTHFQLFDQYDYYKDCRDILETDRIDHSATKGIRTLKHILGTGVLHRHAQLFIYLTYWLRHS